MDHFTKQFTVIDLLGFLFPGAVLVLACQYYYGNATEPFDRFFGAGSPLLVFYFLALSYLVGTLLHESSGFLSRCILSDAAHEQYWDQAMGDTYRSVFKKEPPTDQKGKGNAGREIFHYVQMKLDPHKLRLFSAFAAMSRTMLLTVLIILCIAHLHGTALRFELLLCLIAAIFIFNWMHYQKQRLAYVRIPVKRRARSGGTVRPFQRKRRSRSILNGVKRRPSVLSDQRSQFLTELRPLVS